MVWEFFDIFKNVVSSNDIRDDDMADRLSRRHSVALLLGFCVLVGCTQFVGSPIACWTPAHFTSAMNTYAENICWVVNTYFVPTNAHLPNPNQPRVYRVSYYQWVPFILALMALMFYTPFVIWHLLSKPSGLDLKSIMEVSNHY